MLIYCSTVGETVIIVFLNVVVHQKPLLVLKHLQRNTSCKLFICYNWTGLRRGILLFVYEKNAPAFLLLHGFLLGQKNNISHNIQNVW